MPFLFSPLLKFLKRIVTAEAEENQVRTFYRLYCNFAFPPRLNDSAGLGYENIHVTPISPWTLPNCTRMFEMFRRASTQFNGQVNGRSIF